MKSPAVTVSFLPVGEKEAAFTKGSWGHWVKRRETLVSLVSVVLGFWFGVFSASASISPGGPAHLNGWASKGEP